MPDIDNAEFQTALAKVLLSASEAAALRDSPTDFAKAHSLTSQQVEILSTIDPQRLGEFAHDLLEKRVALLDKLMPNTMRLLDRREIRGETLVRFHDSFPPVHSPVHPNRLVRDAYWFYDMLTDPKVVADLDTPFLVDVITYEFVAARLVNDADAAQQASDVLANPIHPACYERPALDSLLFTTGSHVEVHSFSSDIVAVMRVLLDGSPLPDKPTSPTTLMFHRHAKRRRSGAVRINALTADFLDLLNGDKTVAQVLPLLAERHERPVDDGLWIAAAGILKQFGTHGLIRQTHLSQPQPESA